MRKQRTRYVTFSNSLICDSSMVFVCMCGVRLRTGVDFITTLCLSMYDIAFKCIYQCKMLYNNHPYTTYFFALGKKLKPIDWMHSFSATTKVETAVSKWRTNYRKLAFWKSIIRFYKYFLGIELWAANNIKYENGERREKKTTKNHLKASQSFVLRRFD